MRLSGVQIGLGLIFIFLLGYFTASYRLQSKEGFESLTNPRCNQCGNQWPCSSCSGNKTKGSRPVCPPCAPCREPDLSKYVLKSTVPPPNTCPDMSQYMLKTECPPTPDLSRYVLKSSIPKQQPIIIDSSGGSGKTCGDCPPCPRPRCPEVKCPEPTKCAPPAPCPRPVCPPQVVKCKAEEATIDPVRPFMAPLSMSSFGFV